MMSGMSRARSVVLPAPLQPASPMMRMPPYSKTPGATAPGESTIRGGQSGRTRLLRRMGRCPGRRHLAAGLGELLLDPTAMVLLRPVEVDLAGSHGLERTLHPDGADIDVAQHGGHEQQRHDAMDDLRKLHGGDIGAVA